MAHIDAQRHEGKVALLTGAGSGIGRATALRLAQEGATIVGCDVNREGLDGTLQAIRAVGKDATVVVANVTAQADVDRVVADVLAQHQRIDILGNIAGIMDWFLPAHEVDDETWDRVMAVNVTGVMRLSRRVLPSMMAQHAGAIVNIASAGSFHGAAAGVAYTASKHAVIGITRSVAWTYRNEGIRCNAICPGGVTTNIGTTAVPRSEWGFKQLQPMLALVGEMANPDEIASLFSWLASDEASNVNGALVADDGGWTSA